MRYGIFSDVHSNLEALEEVLNQLSGEAIDQYLVCGDLVGYGADPGECLSKIRSLKAAVIAGNHDWAVCDLFEPVSFNQDALLAVQWTSKELSPDDKAYLKSLPLTHRNSEIEMVHGSLFKPEEFHYLMDPVEAKVHFTLQSLPVCFIGHSHFPGFVYQAREGHIQFDEGPFLNLRKVRRNLRSFKVIVNAGSVGQPRDGNPKASFVIYDSDRQELEIRRVSYEVARAQGKIRQAGLPVRLADRLEEGC